MKTVSKMENIPDRITGRLYRDCRKLMNLKKLMEKDTASFLLTQISSVSERQDSPHGRHSELAPEGEDGKS